MTVKTPLLAINPGEKGIFGIKFEEVTEEAERKYVLFIKWDGKDFENILLKVIFTDKHHPQNTT